MIKAECIFKEFLTNYKYKYACSHINEFVAVPQRGDRVEVIKIDHSLPIDKDTSTEILYVQSITHKIVEESKTLFHDGTKSTIFQKVPMISVELVEWNDFSDCVHK